MSSPSKDRSMTATPTPLRELARDIHYALCDDGFALQTPRENHAMRETILRVLSARQEEVGEDAEKLIVELYTALSDKPVELSHRVAKAIRRLAAVVPAGMDGESGWREALQKVADEWGIDFGGAEAFFFDALRLWKPNKTHLLIHRSDLIESDSYGVYGSDFYRCKLCGAESDAGVLNKGIPHDSTCYLATPPATAGEE